MRQFVGPIPQRIERLPRDKRGFPVPFFVQWIDGEPHFPVMDPAKFAQAVRNSKCWICGQALGGYKAFVIGPMCCVNRATAEPPSHLDCARFAVLNCPFMANPKVGRQLAGDDVIKQGGKVAGVMIERNPGVGCIWVTKSFKLVRVDNGVLFRIGPAERVTFWAHGREATRAEVDFSIETGLPLLRKVAAEDDAANGDRSASRQLELQIDAMRMVVDGVFEERATMADVDLTALGLHNEART